jgi:predicted dehydrogenase
LFVTERAEEVFRAGIEAVVIATHPRFHAALAVAALESGHHVLVEKPCALSTRDAERIRSVAARTGRVVGVGHLLHYHAAYERLVELGRSGALGSLVGTVAERLGSRPRPDVDAWWMLAPHDLSVFHALFGGIFDQLRRYRIEEDDFLALGRFGSAGAVLRVRSGGASSRRFAVIGSHTTALYDDMNEPGTIRLTRTAAPRLRELFVLCGFSSKGAPWSKQTLSTEGAGPDALAVERALTQAFEEPAELLRFPVLPPLERELDAWAAAIREGASLAADARDGLAVVSMLEAALHDPRTHADGFADARVEARVAESGP